MLSFDRLFAPIALGGDRIGVSLSPYAGASLGNVLTEARAGARLSVGTASPAFAARIAPSLSSPGFSNDRDARGWSAFVGVGGRLVAQNVFLDGNTFRNSASVDRELLVGDFEAGFTLDFGPLAIGYTQVFRTREYETQGRRGDFGAITLTGRF